VAVVVVVALVLVGAREDFAQARHYLSRQAQVTQLRLVLVEQP
jgi:hypothetical protein